MRHVLKGLVAVAVAVVAVPSARGQALGPQRQFLAIEPYYEYTRLDAGSAGSNTTLNGYGGRLWINLEPFHLIPRGSIALFTSYAPKQGGGNATALHYGAEYDQYLVRRPLGGLIDPFLAVGGGMYRLEHDLGASRYRQRHWAVSPGGGVRIPMPNRFELRADVKDLIRFNAKAAPAAEGATTHNLVVQGALGLTF